MSGKTELQTDGVIRYPNLDIKVVVIGAGVGGLMSALECWRKGCDVVVLEKAKNISTLGDFFTIPPSGLTTLKHYPSMVEDYKKHIFDCSISIWRPQGQCVYKAKPEWRRTSTKPSTVTTPSFLNRRPVFTRMLYDQCLRLGIPVLFSHGVDGIEESNGVTTVRTPTGSEIMGDVCILANGIGKPSLADMSIEDPTVFDSGYATARVSFPTSAIPFESSARKIVDNLHNQPEFRVYLGPDLHLILFLTDDHVAFAFTHESDGNAAESWANMRDSSTILEELERKCPDWDPAVLELLRYMPSQVVDWGLRWRDPSRNWVSQGGHTIALGDAAHTFLPTAGNGAVQALEDAISLAECLRLGGKQQVPASNKIHNALRFQRVSVLQQTGFVNRDELHHADIEAIAQHPTSAVGFFKIGRWVWGHDAEVYATENYYACSRAIQEGLEFQNTNLPPGHLYHDWNMASENQRMMAGVHSDLKNNGDWGS